MSHTRVTFSFLSLSHDLSKMFVCTPSISALLYVFSRFFRSQILCLSQIYAVLFARLGRRSGPASSFFSKMATASIRWKAHRELFTWWARATAVIVPAALLFNETVFTLAQITGRSMQPTLNPPHDNRKTFWASQTPDLVLVSRWKPALNVRRGDVVSFVSKTNPRYLVI